MTIPAVELEPKGDTFDAVRMWARDLATKFNFVLLGKRNSTRTVTLTANAASTTITDRNIGIETNAIFTPTTANAAAELGNGTLYVSESGRQAGTLVITHNNNAQTDRTFRVTLDG